MTDTATSHRPAVTFPPFPQLTLNTPAGAVTMPVEPIAKHFAITAAFYMTDDQQALLDGTFHVHLYPVGIQLTVSAGCIRCARRAALVWEELALDWACVTHANATQWIEALTPEQRRQFDTYRDLSFRCDTDYCDEAPGDDRSSPMGLETGI